MDSRRVLVLICIVGVVLLLLTFGLIWLSFPTTVATKEFNSETVEIFENYSDSPLIYVWSSGQAKCPGLEYSGEISLGGKITAIMHFVVGYSVQPQSRLEHGSDYVIFNPKGAETSFANPAFHIYRRDQFLYLARLANPVELYATDQGLAFCVDQTGIYQAVFTLRKK